MSCPGQPTILRKTDAKIRIQKEGAERLSYRLKRCIAVYFELEKQYDMPELKKCFHWKWLCQFSSSTEALSLIQKPHVMAVLRIPEST